MIDTGNTIITKAAVLLLPLLPLFHVIDTIANIGISYSFYGNTDSSKNDTIITSATNIYDKSSDSEKANDHNAEVYNNDNNNSNGNENDNNNNNDGEDYNIDNGNNENNDNEDDGGSNNSRIEAVQMQQDRPS